MGDEFVTSIDHYDEYHFLFESSFNYSVYRPMCTHMGKILSDPRSEEQSSEQRLINIVNQGNARLSLLYVLFCTRSLCSIHRLPFVLRTTSANYEGRKDMLKQKSER